MTPPEESALRNWLVDYLVTNVGCSPDDIDLNASFADLGVGSRAAVVLSGELAELVGRAVSPVEMWQHPTIDDLVEFLANPEADNRAVVSEDLVVGSGELIAVVGMGCRLPGGVDGPEALWRLLGEGRCAVGEVPAERWGWFDDGSPESAAVLAGTTRFGAFLDDVEGFDAEFFEISPREAAAMDPQQRLLLEVAHEALEHAGIAAESLRQTQTGVFAGACAGEYGYLASADLSRVDAWSGTGAALSIIANRLSYFLDLRGPSVMVDTACSSSLVAVHLACQSLRSGESSVALAAGVNLLLSPVITRSFDAAEVMSASGRCHSFDAAADGFVRGEGCGVVVLKRLGDALRDGDRVWALVRGSAVNQDGRSNGLMAPNPAAQMAVLRAAYGVAGVPTREVDYVEANATGTLLGDPIEARALGKVLGRGRRPAEPLLIGSVKPVLGHLEAAAGVTGLIKTVLAVQRGRIPANLGFAEPNPHIPFEQLGLKVVAEPVVWPVTGRPRRAGVSSFGFGGTNAHVVLEQGPEPVAVPEVASSVVSTLVVSGKSAQRVAATAGVLAEWMSGAGASVGLAQVAHGLNHHRARQAVFATVAARDREQAVAGLAALAAGRSAPGVVGAHRGVCRAGTVFVYSGQGSQWAGMGARLLDEEPAFAAAVAELEPVFVEVVGFSLREVLGEGAPLEGIERIQPVLVGMQLALTALWRAHGVAPDAVVGHSMGEVTAAVVAGALSPRDGLHVITTRSRLMARLSGQGAMALLELDPDGAAELVAEHPQLTLAVYASPRQTVFAGPPELVDAVIAKVAARDRLARRIEVDVASHHPIIDPILPELIAALADLAPRRPSIPIITTTGAAPTFDADYWAANLRNPVRFTQAVAEAGAEHGTFVEVSPHPVLTYAISDTLADVHHHSIGTLARDADDTLTFHTNRNAAHTVKAPDTEHPAGPPPLLPSTPWQHTRHWVAPADRPAAAGAAPAPGTLLGARTDVGATAASLWQAHLAPETKPYPGCHRLHGVDVVPLSVLLQTLSAAAREAGAVAVSDVRFEHPIVVDRPRAIQVFATDESVTVSSRAASDAPWVRHAGGRPVSSAPDGAAPAAEAAGEAETRSTTELFQQWGVEGQPFPWSIDGLRHTRGGVVADISLAEPAEPSVVALLDAAVHAARLVDRDNPRLLVPSAVKSVWLATTVNDRRAVAEMRRVPGAAGEVVVDLVVRTPEGAVCADVRSLRYTDVDAGSAAAGAHDGDPASLSWAIDWRPWHADGDAAVAPGPLAVVGGSGADATGLTDRLAAAGYASAGLAEARYVVYLAGPAAGDADVEGAARLASEVTDLVRELARRGEDDPVTLWILTRGVREAGSAEALRHSGLWGLAGVIGAEHPELWGGLVDLAPGDHPGDRAVRLTEALPHPARRILALRDDEYLSAAMVPVAGEPVRGTLRCRPDAAYLITGGMGALGLLMARWLADRGARRLVLAGRTPLPPRRGWGDSDDPATPHKITAIRDLERRGVSVDAVTLDVASPGAVRELLARRDRDGAPPIRGVIHAAGITENRLLTETAQDTLRRVMWPKIAGAQALHLAFPPGRLDFFFLTASAGAVFGVPGQGAYAAANAYLDCLARSRHRQGCHALSLDWVAWEGLGFAADAAITIGELERLGSRPVSPGEAFAAWDYVARRDIAQAVIAPMTSADTGGRRAPAPATAWSGLDGDALLRELETALRTVLARELGLPESELESDRPFAELGLQSVMAMSIRREVEQFAGLELSATMLWNHPTIASLSAFLAKKLAPQTDSTQKTEETTTPADSVLDELFDSVGSA